jgi:hypothetical protein
MIYFYVYRITNKIENKHYYGVRQSKILPELDLGIKYFSSSTDKEFIKEQKLNKDHFKYKIVRRFKTKVEACEFELFLLRKFKVHKNDKFYNKGCHSAHLMSDNTGTLVVKEYSSGKYVRVSTDEYKNNKDKYFCNFNVKGVVTCLDVDTGIYKSVNKDIFDSSENLVGVNKFNMTGSKNPHAKKMFIYDNFGELKFVLFGDSIKMTEDYNLPYHNLKLSARKNGEPVGISKQSRSELRKKS